MFAASSLVTLALAALAVAAPAPWGRPFGPRPGRYCDMTGFSMPDTQTLEVPDGPPSFVGIGVGTQNYTCSDAGTYTATGAVADVFDLACIAKTPMFDTIQDTVLTRPVPRFLRKLGTHFFQTNADGSASPKWDFTRSLRNPNGFVIVTKDNAIPAPTGPQDVAWLQLSGIDGGLATKVFRTDTRLGQPDASCTPGENLEVKYSSKYYFYGATI